MQNTTAKLPALCAFCVSDSSSLLVKLNVATDVAHFAPMPDENIWRTLVWNFPFADAFYIQKSASIFHSCFQKQPS